MVVLGLVGQSGSGKSTVADMLARRGAECLDMDVVARRIVEPGTALIDAIRIEFGNEYIAEDGTLKRKALGQLVFSDGNSLARLNRITHPALVREAKAWICGLRVLKDPPEVAVIDAAVLFESGLAELVDKVVVTVASRSVQAQRIAARDGIGVEHALRRIDSQKSVEEMIARADYVVRTDVSMDQLDRSVGELWRQIVE